MVVVVRSALHAVVGGVHGWTRMPHAVAFLEHAMHVCKADNRGIIMGDVRACHLQNLGFKNPVGYPL